MEARPIRVEGSHVFVIPKYSYSLKALSSVIPDKVRYLHKREAFWKDSEGKKHHIKKDTPKSKPATKLILLRSQFVPACCDVDFDPEYNEPVGMQPGSNSERDIIYRWHFVHRHGFPSDIHGSGRGQSSKASDILEHPLSYMLMCNEHHEEYDRENGEWRNPKNRERYQSDS